MTDVERLKQLLIDFGIEFTDTMDVDMASEQTLQVKQNQVKTKRSFLQTIRIQEGTGSVKGYSYFYTDFEFDTDGKFIDVGIWE